MAKKSKQQSKKSETAKTTTPKKTQPKKLTKKRKSINDIPWAEIQSCYGNSIEIPDRIIRLGEKISADEADDICSFLRHELEHQCTIYQATPFATPYLIDLLAKPSEVTTPEILKLLTWLYGSACQVTRECDLELEGKDAVQNPERFRDPSKINSYTTREESIAWIILVIQDVEGAEKRFKKIAASRNVAIRESAKAMLEEIDSQKELRENPPPPYSASQGPPPNTYSSKAIRLDGKELVLVNCFEFGTINLYFLLDVDSLVATFRNKKNAEQHLHNNGLEISHHSLVDYDLALQWTCKQKATRKENENAGSAVLLLSIISRMLPNETSSLNALLNLKFGPKLERASTKEWTTKEEENLKKLFYQGAEVLKRVLGKPNRGLMMTTKEE